VKLIKKLTGLRSKDAVAEVAAEQPGMHPSAAQQVQERKVAAREEASNSAEAAAQRSNRDADDPVYMGAKGAAVSYATAPPPQAPKATEDSTKGNKVNENGHYEVPEREEEYQQWKASLPKHQMTAAERKHLGALHAKQAKEERIVAKREEAANSAEAAAQQAISTVAAARSKLNTAAGDEPPVGESGAEQQGSWAVVESAMAKAKHAAAVKEQIVAPNHDKASSLKRLEHKSASGEAKSAAPAAPAAREKGDLVEHWKKVEAEAKAHIAALQNKKNKMAFMHQISKQFAFRG